MGVLTAPCAAQANTSTAQEEQLDSALPLLGIAATVGGYTVMEAQADVLQCIVTEGLTEDAVTARLHEGRSSYRPFAHTQLTATSTPLHEPRSMLGVYTTQLCHDCLGC